MLYSSTKGEIEKINNSNITLDNFMSLDNGKYLISSIKEDGKTKLEGLILYNAIDNSFTVLYKGYDYQFVDNKDGTVTCENEKYVLSYNVSDETIILKAIKQ